MTNGTMNAMSFYNQGTWNHLDFILKVQGEPVYFQKALLVTASPYFETMLADDVNRNVEGKVVFKNIEALKTVNDYIYSDEIKITKDNIGGLLFISEALGCTSD
uniref:BTB domain-containing protein n=1 Tax=Glossina brevipalpis TaxID=37001 RepID=A0A1A9WP22_9MUSC